MKFVKLAFVGLIAAASVAAQAQTIAQKGMYGEIGYTSINYSYSGYSLSPIGVVRVLIGNDFHENFAVEGMAGFGANDGSGTNASGIPYNMHMDSVFGIYLKPKAKISEAAEVFGRIGYVNITMTGTERGSSNSASVGTGSYGVGVSFTLNRTTAINADFMSYSNKNGEKLDGVTLGVGFRF